ncbi:CR1-gamma [Human mastadenovirus D]|nr:CR1-gamma [Human mastadenovirus D]WPC88791.1 CR1-gamma [Human mastadenovirus D]
MKAFTAFVLISIVTLSLAAKREQYHSYNVTRDGFITLNVTIENTTWTRYHQDGWKQICLWKDPSYTCHSKNGSITIHAFNITSGQYRAESYTYWYKYYGNHKHEIHIFNITVIEHPTTKAPTTPNTATSIKSTTTQPTTRETTQPTTVPTTHPTTTVSTTTETTTHTTQLDTTVQNSTVLVRYLLREESTTEQTEATSSAFSSTANLTSLASINETLVPLMLEQDLRGLDMQITFLVVCGIFILAVLLYFVCCKAREKSSRPIYRPVIGEPQPLQVEGGLRNLLFSFSVW